MIVYEIFIPETITVEYWDEYGTEYQAVPPGCTLIQKPYDDDQALDALRLVRNSRLVACDYTQLPDVGLTPSQVEAWRIYRQELRDITDNLQWGVTTWPTAPW